jgi:hypothetical protein
MVYLLWRINLLADSDGIRYRSVYLAINLLAKTNVAIKKLLNKINENEVNDIKIKNDLIF